MSMARFRRYLRIGSLFLLLAQVVTLSIPPVFASEMTESVDEATLASFQGYKPNYLTIEPQVLSTEVPHEAVQEFSFVEKTFRTSVGQPVLLQFTSTLETNEVLVRIPENGQIVDTKLSSGDSVTHSHGEYWLFKTNQKQSFFELPVVFETPGQYFITVDHDADHFYLEVEERSSENEPTESEVQKKTDFTKQEETDVNDQKQHNQEIETMNESSMVIQPVIVIEKNLSIPEKAIAEEEARILEEITDSQNSRTVTGVTNWSQFRSAWNRSQWYVAIRIDGSINYSSSILGSSLNKVNSSSRAISSTRGGWVNMGTSGNSLELENGELVLNNVRIASENSGVQPLISLDSSSRLNLNGGAVIINRRRTPAVLANNGSQISAISGGQTIYNQVAVSPVQLNRNSRFDIIGWDASFGGKLVIGSNGVSNTWVPPISSDATSILSFSRVATNVMMGGHINVLSIVSPVVAYLTSYSVSWNSVTAEITGVNGSIVTSSNSDPSDFSERYLANHNSTEYRSLTIGATASDGFNPPRPSYALSLEASPLDGGTPTAETTTITQGETTTLQASPTETFDFLRWEIISGTDSMIADETNEVTTFTMGASDTTVRAVFQKKQGGDVLVKYLDESLVQLAEPRILRGLLDEDYETEPIEIQGYTLKEIPENSKGRFTHEEQTVTYLYTKDVLDPVSPVDPLAPETEVDPENPPELPEEQGALSIDFVSRFSFGKQGISAQTKKYYAQPQRLMNPDGTINAEEERPNYVQISDRRDESDRHGWTLSVTQNGQFMNPQKHELKGSRLQLTNQQLAAIQVTGEPNLNQTEKVTLLPGEKTELLTAKDGQGAGTWIYRFGDKASAGKSVALEVPPTAAPKATTYQTNLTWELSSVPDN